MSDSNITKKALAEALKRLLNEYSFEKISVKLICEECGLNRKSFLLSFQRQVRSGELDLLFRIYRTYTRRGYPRLLGSGHSYLRIFL